MTDALARIVFALNVPVAGFVGLATLLAPRFADRVVFQSAAGVVEGDAVPALRVVGAFWTAIALLSVAGAVRPVPFASVLVIQLVYKSCWLLVVALPWMLSEERRGAFPTGMAAFFLVWVAVLPFAIPWRSLAGGS